MLAALLFSSAIAVTFDDLPGSSFPESDRCNISAMSAWNEKLLRTLKKHHAPAIGFVNSAMCEGRDVAPILDLWRRAGEQLGNHTAHHVNLNDMTPEAFERDIVAGEAPLHHAVWFRYPFLHTGPSLVVRDHVARWLQKRGYRNAVVTIDSDEFLYNNAYAAAFEQRNTARAQRIAAAYLRFMEDVTAFYEQRTVEVIGRPIPQVLLLHVSSLCADYLDDLLQMLERRGYRFVSIEDAMRDPAYSLPDGYVGKKGPSWIHRWGLAKGMPIVWEPDAKIPN